MTIIITDEDVATHLSVRDCMNAMRVAFSDFSKGDAVNRPRLRYLARHPDPGLRYMANVHVGAVPSAGVACVRAGSQILRPAGPDNPRRSYENPTSFNWGIVIIYSIETAEPLALMQEFQLSGLRVGATTGAAVEAMSRKDANKLGLFGTGKQARSALEAILEARTIEQVYVYSPNRIHREAFCREMARPGVRITPTDNPRACVTGMDIVACATNAMEPVFDGDWLEDGQFVCSIANSDVTNKRSEVDEKTIRRAHTIIVNDWESVVDNDQTELLKPIEDGIVSRANVHELGDVFTGKVSVAQAARGEKSSGVIYFKNNSGLAIQFAAAGAILHERVLKAGGNKSIPKEWLGSDLSSYYEKGFRPSP
ncbi:MAG: ornithine cyclodeaminase family protein [Beijerinckiaceae bacterium]